MMLGIFTLVIGGISVLSFLGSSAYIDVIFRREMIKVYWTSKQKYIQL